MDNAIQPSDSLRATPAQVPDSAADEIDWTGQVVGEFRILHRLGRGGMGQVYLAEQTSLKRKVALKLLNPELAANERSLLRFKSEAVNVARATHANIVQIYTIDQANGVHYIALEYVEGRNLREFIEKKGTPELSLGLHVMAQVAAALQRASELNVIHRDIKPENILLTKKGEVKVADFGLSRCFEEESQQSITQSQVTMGTPLYMSPEQVERKPVDTRTDIYAFGVTCYHMFAGTPPFKGNSPIEVAYQHVHKEPEPLGDIRPDLPFELCALIHKMMAKKPEDRYQTAREILRDINRLREALNLGAVGAISISSSFIGATPSDGLRASPSQPVLAQAAAKWRRLLLAGVLLALLAGLGIGWLKHLGQPPPEKVVEPPLADLAKDKKPVNLKERERELQQRVQETLKPDSPLDVNAGLKNCADLGLFYLKHRRLDDADAFFQDIGKPEHRVPAYRYLSRFGHAIVLAFKDDAAASNKEFLTIFADVERLGKAKKVAKKNDDQEAIRLLWTDNKSIREMVAKALDHNYANDPQAFPAALEPHRHPPRPNLKAAPPPG